MINRKLNVGDYIFDAKGNLARITKVNKQTYSYVCLTKHERNNVAFNGIKTSSWGEYYDEEWFYCDDPTAKAIESAAKTWHKEENLSRKLSRMEELFGYAKYFLNQLEGIEELEPEELSYEEDDDQDFYDWEAEERGDNDPYQWEEQDDGE